MPSRPSWHSVLLALLCALGCGCSGVQVVDTAGKPIAGAKVYAVSPSMTTGPAVTGSDGSAEVPANAQGAHWISVRCPGHADVTVTAPTTYPIRIVVP